MDKKEAGQSRRDFLKLAGTAAPAAVAAAALAPDSAEAAEATGEGMRKTEHVKKYLESARF
ncbi:MAG: ubiquinol-cytochrome c reductase iron-sulfur subunit N-terminal domain-containing protein [Rhodobacter sp.]|nr:ubiquinol-cytochrome c reductase iron-sulfur subunit N-terminal domain-containing protein [Rhodobacter sp.]